MFLHINDFASRDQIELILDELDDTDVHSEGVLWPCLARSGACTRHCHISGSGANFALHGAEIGSAAATLQPLISTTL